MIHTSTLLALLSAVLMVISIPAAAQITESAGAPEYTVVDRQTLRFDLGFALPLPGDGGDYSSLPAPTGFDPAAIAGLPLPAFSTELAARATAVSIEAVDVVEIEGASLVAGALGDVVFPERGQGEALSSSTLRGILPAEWAVVGNAGERGGVELSSLTIHPYRFDASRGVILWARRIVVRVSLAPGSDARSAGNVAGVTFAAGRKLSPSFSIRSEQRSRAIIAPDGFEYKLVTGRDGVYRVGAEDLIGIGVPLQQIDSRTLKLYRDGIEIPVHVADQGNDRLEPDRQPEEFIEFHAVQPRARTVEPGSDLYHDPHTIHATYFLTWGGSGGKRLVDESADLRARDGVVWTDLTAPTTSFRSTVHLEENLVAATNFNAHLNTPSDRFDRKLWQHIPANAQAVIPVTFPDPDLLTDAAIRLVVALRGSSGKGVSRQETEKKNHNVEIFFQNRRALLARFRGDGLAFASSDSGSVGNLSSRMLPPDGEGNIAIINRYDGPGLSASSISVNWIELAYPRLYRAFGDRLEFSIPEGTGMRYFRFRLRGFSSPEIAIYRKGISRLSNITVVPQSEAGSSGEVLYDAIFQVYAASPQETFVAVAQPSVLRPIVMRDSSARLIDPRNAWDYIVIVDELASDPGRLSDATHPLRRFIDLKRRQGYEPRIVRAVDIYDEFSGGRVSPEAIRDFFAYAWHNWATRPKYALIVGNGTPMKREALAHYFATLPDSMVRFHAERSYVPTIHFQTVDFGATPCDWLLGCIGMPLGRQGSDREQSAADGIGDFFPEVIVGRVNVLTQADVFAYFDKLISQETTEREGLWRATTGFVGGNSTIFPAQIDRLVGRHYRSISEPHRIYTSPAYSRSVYSDADRLLSVMREPGAALVTYMGHGGGGQWEDVALLNAGNIFQMQNADRMGTVLSYTCFTGAYDARYGLLSAMMIHPGSGAISALGTAGLGWLQNNGLLADAISSVISNPRYSRLSFGEVVALGKARYIGIHQRSYPEQVPTVAAMFSIFGDPSLGLPLVRDTVTLRPASAVVAAGGSMRATTILPFTPATMTLSLFDSSEVAFATRQITGAVAGLPVALDGNLPVGYSGSYAGMRIYAASSDGRRASGSVRFSTSDGSIVQAAPAGRLVAGSSASFELRIAGAGAPDSVIAALDYDGIYRFTRRKLSLEKTGEGVYQTDTLGAGWIEPGARVTLQVAVPRSIDGLTTFSFHAEGGPDPAAFAPSAADTARARYGGRAEGAINGESTESIRIVSGTGGADLAATLHNWGESEARDVPWSLSIDSSGNARVLASGRTTIPARDSVRVQSRLPALAPVEQRVTLELHPAVGDHWSDAYRRNNRAFSTLVLTAGHYTAGAGFTAGSFDFAPAGSATLATPGSASEGIVTATLLAGRPESAQPWSFLEIGDATLSGGALQLRSLTPAGEQATLRLKLKPDTSHGVEARGARIVRYNPSTKLWLALETMQAASGAGVEATVPATGIYALAISDDRRGPEVRFSVEGQFYSDSVVVPVDARFSAVIHDPAGIDTDPARLRVRLDGVELQAGSEYVLLDSTITPTTMNVRLQKRYTAGSHTLEVETSDRLGNVGTGQTIFQVETDLRLNVFGNFPNPFNVETFLAYEIGGVNQADKVELIIFSTAGKPVRSFYYPASQPYQSEGLLQPGSGVPTSAGYHEAWWDGRDDMGNQVANGVYFYRLRITLGDEVAEQIGTMARVR